MEFCNQFKELLRNSVIPGIPQIVITRNVCKKALKVVVFICCAIGFFWQTFSFLTVYWTYPTVVDVEYESPELFDLPAVTICSYNGINSDLFCNRFPDLCHPNASIEDFCREHSNFCDANYNSYENESYATVTPRELPQIPRTEYRDMGTKVDEIVIKCYVRESSSEYDCTNDYESVFVFDTTGLPNNCYAFNSLWGKTKGARFIRSDSDLVFYLKAERVHAGQFYPGTPFAIQMSLHNPYAILNPFRDGFSIDPCSSYYIYPSKQSNTLLPPPYTTACYNYTTTWMARSGKGPVTKKLCMEECILNKSIEAVRCVDPYYITYPNMEQICQAEPDNAEYYRKCSDICSPACELAGVVRESDTLEFLQREGSLRRVNGFLADDGEEDEEIQKLCQEEISVDVQELPHMTTEGIHEEDVCFSTIIISFSRMAMVKYSYSPKYEDISLFSYIGGYLGMWLGISLMAICDIVETAVLVMKWLLLQICRNRSRNKIHPRPQEP